MLLLNQRYLANTCIELLLSRGKKKNIQSQCIISTTQQHTVVDHRFSSNSIIFTKQQD